MKQLFISACLFLLCFRALPAVGEEPSPTISVIGEAAVSIAADEIVIHASIESLAKGASQACKDNQEKSRRLIEFLKAMKINDQQIDADLLSITSIAPQESSSGKKGGKQSASNDDPFGRARYRLKKIGFLTPRMKTVCDEVLEYTYSNERRPPTTDEQSDPPKSRTGRFLMVILLAATWVFAGVRFQWMTSMPTLQDERSALIAQLATALPIADKNARRYRRMHVAIAVTTILASLLAAFLTGDSALDGKAIAKPTANAITGMQPSDLAPGWRYICGIAAVCSLVAGISSGVGSVLKAEEPSISRFDLPAVYAWAG